MALVLRDTFDFILDNELKRAVRAQNFVTLVLIEARGIELTDALGTLARLIQGELRETDLVSVGETGVSVVLLEADLVASMRAIERVMQQITPYQFQTPLDVRIGAACCPTQGCDAETLKRVASVARANVAPREPRNRVQL